MVKRTDSIQSRRKVSSLSDRSDNSEQGAASGGEEESPGILSDDQPPDSPNDSNDSDETSKNFPWMRAVTAIINSFNFYCTHQNFCHPYCYKRHTRAASRLMKSVRKVSRITGAKSVLGKATSLGSGLKMSFVGGVHCIGQPR